jgi:bleomycin hydrolase
MVERMSEFLDWCREEDFWDEEAIIGSIRLIMDATMGRPPEQVTWQGRDYTPRDFLRSVCDLDPADYVSLISTSSIPFWTRGEYAVPDNWWHDTNYLNVPLKPWFEALKATVVEGGSLVIGGDVSEPGLWGLKDVAIVPTFDIPGEYIDQDSREFRFVNRSSTDDHLIHIVGTTTVGDHDWFLIKDSNRSSRLGAHEGYYFYREDYVRLKMLMYTVHKDRVVDLLTKVDKN